MKTSFSLLSLIITLTASFSSILSKILFVFEQCRHGPQGDYFAKSSHFVDQYDNQWKGNGELTGVGMRMHYLIGVRSRQKYKGLFKKTYDPREIYVKSTDQNRTISSAQSQLLGMFPPRTGIELKEEELKFSFPPIDLSEEAMEEIKKLKMSVLPERLQIVPIHFFHHNEREYLLTDEVECPKMKYIKEENIKAKLVQDFIHKFNETYGQELLRFFNHTNCNFLFDYETISGITEQFISGYVHNRNLTKLETYGINLTEFYMQCQEFKMIDLYSVTSTPEIGIMAMSPTIRKIVNWMDKSIENSINNNSSSHYLFPKFVMYSGHDHTIVPMEQYMQKSFNTDVHFPDFAANQFFELHELEHGDDTKKKIEDYYVEYYYNDNLILNISYTNFRDKVLELAWTSDDINEFCNVSNYFTIDYICYIILGLSIVVFVLTMSKQIICSATRKRKGSRQRRKEEKEYGDDGIELKNKNVILLC